MKRLIRWLGEDEAGRDHCRVPAGRAGRQLDRLPLAGFAIGRRHRDRRLWLRAEQQIRQIHAEAEQDLGRPRRLRAPAGDGQKNPPLRIRQRPSPYPLKGGCAAGTARDDRSLRFARLIASRARDLAHVDLSIDLGAFEARGEQQVIHAHRLALACRQFGR